MRVRYLAVTLAVALSTVACSTGVSQEDYDTLSSQKDSLEGQIEETQTKLEAALADTQSLQSDLASQATETQSLREDNERLQAELESALDAARSGLLRIS